MTPTTPADRDLSREPAGSEQAVADLAARACAGDTAAFDRLFRLTGPRVLLYARLRMGPALRAVAEPDDVLQDSWLAAWRALPRYEHHSLAGLSRWLCRIAESSLRGLVDRHGARKRSAPGADLGPDVLERWADTATGVATAAARGEETLHLEQALAALPDDERQVLLLRFFQGLTIDEIADLLRDAPTTVRRRLGRAAALLGDSLGRLGPLARRGAIP